MNSNKIFDARVPSSLKEIQLWFGRSLIGSPYGENYSKYILEDRYRSAEKRFQVYRHQFWGRLLEALHEVCPLLYTLFGSDFDRLIGRPFLISSLPHHWSLDFIAEDLSQWIVKEYQGEDREFIWNVARLDWGHTLCLLSAHFPLREMSAATFFEEILYLQPHLQLFCFKGDLISFREEVLKKEFSYWKKRGLPYLDESKKHYFALHRDRENRINYRELSAAAFYLLESFREGCSLSTLVDNLEKQEPYIIQEAEKHLQNWIKEWVGKEWLWTTRLA